METRLIYISSAAYESQVINLLRELVEYGYFEEVVLMVSEPNDSVWEGTLEKFKDTGIRFIKFKKYPNYHFYKKAQSFEFIRIFKSILKENTIIHIRGDFFAGSVRHALKKIQLKDVFIYSDVRGASYEETKFYKKNKPILQQLKLYQQRKNLKLLKQNSDYVSCVSEKLKDYVIERSKFIKKKIFINHCIAGSDFSYDPKVRNEYREKLGIDKNEILFLFMTGGNSNWQNTIEIIDNIAEKGYKILNLSKLKFTHKRVINKFVDYNEVYKYLNASDIGIVWRNDDVVNNVACPIKFGEYVCCGLPVIANTGVDLINTYIDRTNYGLTIRDFDQINENNINNLVAIDRNEISENAQKMFAVENVARNYFSNYKEIVEKS